MMIPKFNYFRSTKHLKNVASLPCQICYVEGRTQASHSNQAVHGKGRSLRASDEFTAAICVEHHYEIDQGSNLTKQQRVDMWNEAYQKTVNRLKSQNLWPDELSTINRNNP
jgi:hypothetical protein